MSQQHFSLDNIISQGTVSGVILSPDKTKILAVQKILNSHEGDTGKMSREFGFPGGGVRSSSHESLGGALRREVYEETGVTIGDSVFICTKDASYHHSFWLVKDHNNQVEDGPSFSEDNELENGPPTWVNIMDIVQGTTPWFKSQITPLYHALSVAWKDEIQSSRHVAEVLEDIRMLGI